MEDDYTELIRNNQTMSRPLEVGLKYIDRLLTVYECINEVKNSYVYNGLDNSQGILQTIYTIHNGSYKTYATKDGIIVHNVGYGLYVKSSNKLISEYL